MADNNGSISQAQDFAPTPSGWAQRWTVELQAARKEHKKWKEQGKRITRRFTDERNEQVKRTEQRVNLFTANIQTQRAMMYGKMPRVDVRRRFNDTQDVAARVASQILTRLLNQDIEAADDGYTTNIGLALDDRLLVGFGNCRVRLEQVFEKGEEIPAVLDPKTGAELAPAVPPEERKVSEKVHIEYVHWDDQLWSSARTYGEVRWWGYRAFMTRDELVKEFGPVGKRIPITSKKPDGATDTKNDPWEKAEVWEIWHKADRKVYTVVEGFEEVLKIADDPLKLTGFFPHPRPMMANVTNLKYVPRADFIIARDLYNEIDYVSTRITWLERAVKVVGAYDASNISLQRMLTEGVDNDLIPVENWAAFAEKGGMKGVVDWLPVDMVVQSLDKLREYRGELIQLLYDVTGMSDIMRGAADERRATATEQALKAKFASVRMQSFQDDFARFASELLALKAEIICRFFDDQTIVSSSNIEMTPDASSVPAALQLLRNEVIKYRIEVKPENVSITDFAQIKQERVEFMGALTQFLQAAGPIGAQAPEMVPYLLELLKWALQGFRSADEVEAILDQAVKMMQQKAAMIAQQGPKPDPKAQADMMKAQMDMKVKEASAQMDLQKQAQKNQLDLQKARMDMALKQQNHQMNIQQNQLEHQQAMAHQHQQGQLDQQQTLQSYEAQLRNDAMRSFNRGGGQ